MGGACGFEDLGLEGPGISLDLGSSVARGGQTWWGTGYGTQARYDRLGEKALVGRKENNIHQARP